jgi:putative transcriptional regulator
LTSLENQFLIAMPQMEDPNFSGSLTYICEHNEDGAMGIVINRPTDIGLVEMLEQLELKSSDLGNVRVFAGGPVERDRGFIIHDGDQQWQASLDLSSTLKLTSSLDILEAIAQGEGPENYIVALGYAGWGGGQLEAELAENTWLSCKADELILFAPDNQKKLAMAMARLGINAAQLSSQVGHA